MPDASSPSSASSEGYYLIAHCTNAVSLERTEVQWEVASQAVTGDWYTNDGTRVTPFLTIPIDQPTPTIPEGWIEHLHELARKHACANRAPTISLAEALGIKPKPQPSTPIVRRF